MNTDLSFITNEENQTLKERFEVLIKDTAFFDCLVGYFYTSGFQAIYRSLEKTKKIRILIGLSGIYGKRILLFLKRRSSYPERPARQDQTQNLSSRF